MSPKDGWRDKMQELLDCVSKINGIANAYRMNFKMQRIEPLRGR